MHFPSVTAEKAYDSSGNAISALKIQTDTYELNIYFKPEEVGLVRDVRAANWDDRGSLAIGRTAGATVFWCSHKDSVSIMAGYDDDTWDFCVTLPLRTLDDMLDALEKHRAKA